MKTTVFGKTGEVRLVDQPRPQIQQPDDVIIKIVRTDVCGTDLWNFKGVTEVKEGSLNKGHEALGIIDEIGADITTFKPGDFVIAPFSHGCGHCAVCRAGFDGICQTYYPDIYSEGMQGEYVRFQHANWALIKVPGKPSDYTEGMLKSLLTLADVMATGYHAARVANVKPGDTVVVSGDGAVGLCAIIAAKMKGAKRIISTSRHADRLALAKEFGATDNVSVRGDEGVEQILALTENNIGVDAVLECVGTQQSVDTASKVVRPGGFIGRVGSPLAKIDMTEMFWKDVTVSGGSASVTTYDKNILLKAVLDGDINPGKVFTKTFSLDQVQEAYEAMANREAIKSYIVVD